jgi:hypothetical protein
VKRLPGVQLEEETVTAGGNAPTVNCPNLLSQDLLQLCRSKAWSFLGYILSGYPRYTRRPTAILFVWLFQYGCCFSEQCVTPLQVTSWQALHFSGSGSATYALRIGFHWDWASSKVCLRLQEALDQLLSRPYGLLQHTTNK